MCTKSHVKFDGTGAIFGVLCEEAIYGYTAPKIVNWQLKLYDSRNIDSGPYTVLMPNKDFFASALMKAEISRDAITEKLSSGLSSFSFSTDGNNVLINTKGDLMYILDAFSDNVEPIVLTGRKNDANLQLGACFSNDSNYVITGNEDNDVLIYDKSIGYQNIGTLKGHTAPVSCCSYNPRYDQLATGCLNTVLWIPKHI